MTFSNLLFNFKTFTNISLYETYKHIPHLKTALYDNYHNKLTLLLLLIKTSAPLNTFVYLSCSDFQYLLDHPKKENLIHLQLISQL